MAGTINVDLFKKEDDLTEAFQYIQSRLRDYKLVSRLARYRKILRDQRLCAKYNTLDDKFDTVRKENSDLQQLNERYREENKDCLQKLSRLSEDITNLQKENKDIKQRLDQYEKVTGQKDAECAEYKELNRRYKEAYRSINSTKGELETKCIEYDMRYKKMEAEAVQNEKRVSDLQKRIESLQKGNDSLMQRLMVATKMKDDNPNIADLSDQNRPLKLGERFSEIYDNLWTDVLDALFEQNNSEEANVKELLVTLQIIYKNCHDLVQRRKNRILKSLGYQDDILQNEDVGKEGHDPDIGMVKNLLLKSAKRLVKYVSLEIQKIQSIKDLSRKSGKDGENFVNESIEVIMYMILQDPPMFLDFSYGEGSEFDKHRLRPFFKSGDFVKYLVWPVLYLHCKNGPIICTGIAQGM